MLLICPRHCPPSGPHGHLKAQPLLDALKKVSHHDVAAHVARLQTCHNIVLQRFNLRAVKDQFRTLAYRENGYMIVKNQKPARKLLVVFSTMFNNFFLSNLVLCRLLSDLDCHILYLKDATLFNYHHGVESFAHDLPGIAEGIRIIADKMDTDHIYFSGFSSSGYAALLTSLLMPSAGYLGFSHETDLSPGAQFPPNKYFTPEVRAKVNPRWLINLRAMLEVADPTTPRWLYYGEKSQSDVGHARGLEGLPGIKLVCLPDIGHNTVAELLAKGELVGLFSRLIADR